MTDATVRTVLAAAPVIDPWGEPDLSVIRSGRRKAPELPREVFGPFWSQWLTAAAEGAGAPVDYVAAALLSGGAATLGNARWVSPWQGWKEPSVLWIGCVGDPSSGKSPALDPVLDLLRTLEAEMAAGFEMTHRQYQTDREAAKLAYETWQAEVRQAHKSNTPPPIQPAAAVEPAEPVRPRVVCNDATPEKLAQLAAAHPKGLLFTRDELAGWFGNFDRYGGSGADRALWLEAFGGRSYTVDRVKHPLPLTVPHLSVSVLGGIQPDKLAGLLAGPDDGLPARFLWMWPDPLPPCRPKRVADPAPALAAFRRLASLTLVPAEDGNSTRPWIVPLAPDAADLFEAWRIEHAAGQANTTGALASAWGKAPGQLLRLALVLEFLWWAAGPPSNPPPSVVSARAVAAAAGLMSDYCTTPITMTA